MTPHRGGVGDASWGPQPAMQSGVRNLQQAASSGSSGVAQLAEQLSQLLQAAGSGPLELQQLLAPPGAGPQAVRSPSTLPWMDAWGGAGSGGSEVGRVSETLGPDEQRVVSAQLRSVEEDGGPPMGR